MERDRFLIAAAELRRELSEVGARIQADPEQAERDQAAYRVAYGIASKTARIQDEREAFEKWKEWRDDPNRDDSSAVEAPRFEFPKMYVPKVGRLPEDVPRLFPDEIYTLRKRVETGAALLGVDVGEVGAEVYKARCARRAAEVATHLGRALSALDAAMVKARQLNEANAQTPAIGQEWPDALSARLRLINRELHDYFESETRAILNRLSATGGRQNPNPLLELLEGAIKTNGDRVIDACIRSGITDPQIIHNALENTIRPLVVEYIEKYFRRRSLPPRAIEETERRVDYWFGVFPDRIIVAIDDGAQMPEDKSGVVQERGASQRVFVVHGRDDGAKDTVARFLERLGLEAIILHELLRDPLVFGAGVADVLAGSMRFSLVFRWPRDHEPLHGKDKNPTPRLRPDPDVHLSLSRRRLARTAGGIRRRLYPGRGA